MVDRIPHDAPVLVIGLGRFGAATAGQLARLDREVLAIDGDINLVQKWSERLTHTVQADARSIDALKQVGASVHKDQLVRTSVNNLRRRLAQSS